jgi:hypothetical protein
MVGRVVIDYQDFMVDSLPIQLGNELLCGRGNGSGLVVCRYDDRKFHVSPRPDLKVVALIICPGMPSNEYLYSYRGYRRANLPTPDIHKIQ